MLSMSFIQQTIKKSHPLQDIIWKLRTQIKVETKVCVIDHTDLV